MFKIVEKILFIYLDLTIDDSVVLYIGHCYNNSQELESNMKKLVVGLALLASFLNAEVLTIKSDNWMPFNGDPKGKDKGYIIDLVKEIFEPAGITIDYQVYPWVRSLQECEDGTINAVVGAYKEDVEGFVLPSEAVDFTYESYFKLKENKWQYDGIKSLESEKLGYIIDYATEENFLAYIDKNKATPKVQLVGGDNPLETNIKKLLAGRITILLDNYNVIVYNLKQMQLSDKIIFAGNENKTPRAMFIAFSPKHPKSKAYAAMFDKGFKELKTKGRVNEIRKKYSMEPLK